MKCPLCSLGDSKVVDSRSGHGVHTIRRRRECLRCMHRFTTFENIDLTMQVKKRDGRYENFSIEKLIAGIDAAALHTRISHDRVRKVASEIVVELLRKQLREIEAMQLGEIVMRYLKSLDVIAYIRFACVYRRFKDMDELIDAIQDATPVAIETQPKVLEG